MKNKVIWLCVILLSLVCVASIGFLAMAQYDADDLRLSVTIESKSITGINGGAVRHMTLGVRDTMQDDFVQLAKNAPIWYVSDDKRAYVFFGSDPVESIVAKACDAHGNEQDLPCAQNMIDLPDASGEYTIGVWANKGRDSALYAFRIHVIGD